MCLDFLLSSNAPVTSFTFGIFVSNNGPRLKFSKFYKFLLNTAKWMICYRTTYLSVLPAAALATSPCKRVKFQLRTAKTANGTAGVDCLENNTVIGVTDYENGINGNDNIALPILSLAYAASIGFAIMLAIVAVVTAIICCVNMNRKKRPRMSEDNPYNLAQYGLIDLVDTDRLDPRNIHKTGFESSNFRVVKDALNKRLTQINGALPVEYISDAIRALIQHHTHDTANYSQVERLMYQTDMAMAENDELEEDAGVKAEMFWSSATKIQRTELCSILNAAIRADDPCTIVHAVVFAKGIEIRRNMDRENLVDLTQKYPDKKVTADMFPGGKFPHYLEHENWLACFRGGGFNDKFQDFFTVGKYYRCPGFLATSTKEAISRHFMLRQQSNDRSTAVWTILLDARGITDPQYRCMHASFVNKSHQSNESEFLFSPYSVFQVVATEWSSSRSKPHSIVLRAAIDNIGHEEDLPLAPWY